MITLEIRISGNGPAHFNFSSGQIAAVHLSPPTDGSGLAMQIGNLQASSLSLSPGNGVENTAMVDITEGVDPIWLALTIDCTGGGSVSVGFSGSPTVRVNAGSFIGLEYNNGHPAPMVSSQEFQ
ncbi:MAG: hypothetical protein ABIS50_22650 [Luteolibacter sp.]|uniref:hypothetical protein n=1 Tax=Luteolibacter sp. TaxID=1962973 RepID=UPI0032648783